MDSLCYENSDSMRTWNLSPVSSRVIDGSVPFNWFSCIGEVGYKDTRLSPNGFVLKDEMNICNDPASLGGNLERQVVLFGRNFDQDGALLLHSKLLFLMARKELMMLSSASILNSHLINSASMNLPSEVEQYKQIRMHLCELLSFTRCYLGRMLKDENSAWLIDKLVPLVADNLMALKRHIRSIMDLPDYVLVHSANSLGNKCLQASYHLFHMHLDLRWYYITIQVQLMRCHRLHITQDDNAKLKNTVEEESLQVLSDLILVAIDKFEKIPLSATLKTSPFNCTCIKELWLLLQLHMNQQHARENGKPFWTCLNQLLDVILGKAPAISSSSSVTNLPKQYKCSDPASFCLWLLVHVAQLNGYTQDGEFVGITSGRVQSNYKELEAILKVCVTGERNITESQLRVINVLITVLMTEWWEPKTEPIMVMWEYYHRHLNCAFFLPGATPDAMSMMSKSGAGLLKQVKSRLEDSSPPDSNSFGLFLSLLGKHLTHCATQNQRKHWQQMKGRIYSKFSTSKVQSLTEMGLYHLVSLFLTLSVAVSAQEVGNKLQDLLSILPTSSTDLSRLHVSMKANLALVLLYIERGLDILDVSQPLQVMVTDLCSQKNNSIMLLRTYVEGIQDIMSSGRSLHLSEYCLIGDWIPQYLSFCSVSDSCRLLDIVANILMKIRESFTIVIVEESDHNRKMAEALSKHVLPFIQTQSGNLSNQPPFQVADAAAGFTLLALEQPEVQTNTFEQLFLHFVGSDKMNVKLQKRFLGQILQEEAVMRLVAETTCYENNVIQAWVRCCMLLANDSTDDLLNLTRLVSRLPAIQNLSQGTEMFVIDANDALFTFIKLIGEKYSKLQDINRKAAFREKSLVYLAHVDSYVNSVVNYSSSSNELISRIYVCAACMVHYCGQVLYMKSKPNCLLPRLIQSLLLPHAIYKSETQLHPYIAAAIKKTLHEFVFGLFKLSPKLDGFVGRVLNDIVVIYVTRLVNKTTNIRGVFNSHPLLKCCIENEDPEVCKFVLETLSNKFLSCKGNTPQEHSALVLVFIMDLINMRSGCVEILQQIINVSLMKVLEIFMFVEIGHVVRKHALELIKLILNSSSFNEAESKLRESFTAVIHLLCQKHLSFSSGMLFKFYINMGQLPHGLVLDCLPQLQEEVKIVEQRRGVGYDPGLRSGLGKVMASLGMQ